MSIFTSLRTVFTPSIFLLATLTLTGCGIGSLAPSVAPATSSLGAISGGVHGGQPPVSGSHIYLYAVGTGGYGAAATSLLQSAANTASDGTNYFVTTASDGSFSISGDYTCTTGQALYLYATGGSAGQGTNSAIGFLAALGTCPGGNIAATVPYVWINEVSTVAAAYALAGFAVSPTSIASSNTALAKTGVANAIANVPNIMNIATGNALTTTTGSNAASTGTVPTAKINTLANILASCINSTSSSSSACTTLFANAPTSTGVQPTNTAQAAINMAHVPSGYTSAAIKNLYGLSTPQPAFPNALTSVPNDLALPVVYTSSLLGANNMSADAAGNIWVSDQGETVPAFFKIAPQGTVTKFLFPASYGINAGAIAPTGLLWFTDVSNNAVRVYNTSGALQFTATGGGLIYPQNLAFDSAGNAWILNYGDPTKLSEFDASGNVLRATPLTTAANTTSSIGIDSTNAFWFASFNNVFYLPSPYTTISTYSAFSGTGFLALDNTNSAWFNDPGYPYRYTTTGTQTSCPGYSSDTSGRIAIDGAGVAWATNTSNTTYPGVLGVTAACTVLSGPNGLSNGTPAARRATPISIAVDNAGSLWTVNPGYDGNGVEADTFTQYLGLATPVATPILPGQLGTRP